jgi:hypothetical protein
MVKRWGRSITIENKPTVITDPNGLVGALSALQVSDGNETIFLKTVAGRIATPYEEKTGWVGKCACNITRQGQACLLHEFLVA